MCFIDSWSSERSRRNQWDYSQRKTTKSKMCEQTSVGSGLKLEPLSSVQKESRLFLWDTHSHSFKSGINNWMRVSIPRAIRMLFTRSKSLCGTKCLIWNPGKAPSCLLLISLLSCSLQLHDKQPWFLSRIVFFFLCCVFQHPGDEQNQSCGRGACCSGPPCWSTKIISYHMLYLCGSTIGFYYGILFYQQV